MTSSVGICGIGTAAPDGVIGRQESLRLARLAVEGGEESKLAALYEGSGVHSRSLLHGEKELADRILEPLGDHGRSTRDRLEHYGDAAVDMACDSARIALMEAGAEAGEVTHLVTVSCTGAESPGPWLGIQNRLGLNEGIARTHVGFMGCHGALNGLAAARAFASEHPDHVVLLVCVEVCSIHYHVGGESWDRQVANAIFADGAASAVVSQRSGGPRLAGFSSRLFPGTSELMSWRIGDHGFDMRLSPRVPVVLKRAVSPWITSWFKGLGLDFDDIGAWAVHPGGRDILEGVRQGLGLEHEQLEPSMNILRNHGNMSSSTVLWILRDLITSGCRGPVVCLAFGPGLVGEGVLLVDE